MREEEKVARDVYLTLNAIYDLSVFENVASSEAKHMDAVLEILNLFSLSDLVINDEIGAFTDPNLQVLYDEMMK